MNLFPLLLCSLLLVVPMLISVAETKHHLDGIKHVIALKVIHKKVKKIVPKLLKNMHVVPVPMPLHVAQPNKKGFVVLTPKLPHHLPPVSPCKYAKYWHPKDRHGAGCDHHFKW